MGPNTKLDDTTIELPEAIERTTFWREKFMNTFTGSGPSNVFRGFLIPIQDLVNITKHFPEGEITHARAYVSAVQNSADERDVTLSVVLVPAGGPDQTDRFSYMDEEGVEKSTIYDFTQPCPPCCDVTSPLHGPTTGGVE